MNPNNTKWIALFFGFLFMAALMVPEDKKNEGRLVAPQDGEELCLAKVESGSTKPFPTSGPMELSLQEAQSLKASQPMDMGGEQLAEVWVSNKEERAATVLFLGEDGRPRAKAFLRPSSQVKMNLREGSYDVRFEAGTDWLGDHFGNCSGRGKVAGIVVAKPGLLSKVELSAAARFVVGNRLDLAVAQKGGQETLAQERPNAINTTAQKRPEREARDPRPESALVRSD